MNKINVLDCTLRDGGYVNEWQFGQQNIKKIIGSLTDSKVDIIECGFLTEKKKSNSDNALFNDILEIDTYFPSNKGDSLAVCMINYGEYDVKKLPLCGSGHIDGIRLAFHKKDVENALEMGKVIIEKGYKLFVQPMVSMSYSDEEFIKLVRNSNLIEPYAFYIVDSFGVMKRSDIMRMFYLIDHNLDKNIHVGYHSHNNIQMAYSNAQALVEIKTNRTIIIDSCVLGMGRGAGNLNTELLIEHLNETNNSDYRIKPLLRIIDQVLNRIHAEKFWGYSLPYYLSATNNCHPNYAMYLDQKKTLKAEDINNILSEISELKMNNFDKSYIEELYTGYQNQTIEDIKAKEMLKNDFLGKTIVLIVPGRSIYNEIDKIKDEIKKEDNIVISVNFIPEKIRCDYVFVSNLRRYEEMKDRSSIKGIKTSNIKTVNKEWKTVNYSSLTNNTEAVEDNATLMLMQLLIDIGVVNVKIAGLDGYTHDLNANYVGKDMAFVRSNDVLDAMNIGLQKMLKMYSEKLSLDFITKQHNVKLGGY